MEEDWNYFSDETRNAEGISGWKRAGDDIFRKKKNVEGMLDSNRTDIDILRKRKRVKRGLEIIF